MSRALPRARQIFEALRRHGLGLPGAREDHPWGEVVLKAKDKVFVFLGRPEEGKCGFSLKLPDSGEGLLDQDYAQPTGYGLGKSGWITLDFAPGFQMGHPSSFALARAVAELAPGDLDHVFFANSGSEAVDSALEIALA